jgi:hypothetical protein
LKEIILLLLLLSLLSLVVVFKALIINSFLNEFQSFNTNLIIKFPYCISVLLLLLLLV